MIYLEASELEKAANLFVVLVSSCLLDLKKYIVLVIENPGNRTSVVKKSRELLAASRELLVLCCFGIVKISINIPTANVTFDNKLK